VFPYRFLIQHQHTKDNERSGECASQRLIHHRVVGERNGGKVEKNRRDEVHREIGDNLGIILWYTGSRFTSFLFYHMKYSLTHAGIIGAIVLPLLGQFFSEACAKEIFNLSLPTLLSLPGLLAAWIGRIRAGGVNWFGARV